MIRLQCPAQNYAWGRVENSEVGLDHSPGVAMGRLYSVWQGTQVLAWPCAGG